MLGTPISDKIRFQCQRSSVTLHRLWCQNVTINRTYLMRDRDDSRVVDWNVACNCQLDPCLEICSHQFIATFRYCIARLFKKWWCIPILWITSTMMMPIRSEPGIKFPDKLPMVVREFSTYDARAQEHSMRIL